jgi:hypothetical protein
LLTLWSCHGSKGSCSAGGAANKLFDTSVTISGGRTRGIPPSWC